MPLLVRCLPCRGSFIIHASVFNLLSLSLINRSPNRVKNMQIEIFTACDIAQLISGKVVLSGTFHFINATDFPVKSTFAVVIAMSLSEEEINQEQHLVLKCVSPSGEVLFEPEQKFAPNEPYVSFVINLRDILLSTEGVYRLELYWNGSCEQVFSFTAKKQ